MDELEKAREAYANARAAYVGSELGSRLNWLARDLVLATATRLIELQDRELLARLAE